MHYYAIFGNKPNNIGEKVRTTMLIDIEGKCYNVANGNFGINMKV